MHVRILGIDFGTSRIGLALSDPLGIIAQPYETLSIGYGANQVRDPVVRIAEIIIAQEIGCVVTGRPVRMSGEDGPAVLLAEAFVTRLQAHTSVPIVWWDERLTTKAAERALIDAGMRRKKRRACIDQVAAALILQSYLDSCARPTF